MSESRTPDYFDEGLRKLNEGTLPPAPDRIEHAVSRPELRQAVAACFSSGGGLYYEKYIDFCQELISHGFTVEEADYVFSNLKPKR